MSQSLVAVLEAALEAARGALRDLDADQVPNDLRRVAGYAGRLPPPLQTSLMKGLESYEWLRTQAAERLPGGDEDDKEAAARLYLERPDGWGVRLAELAADRAAADAAGAIEAAAAKAAAAGAALKAARAKAKVAAKESRAALAALEQRLAAQAAERRSEAAGDARVDKAAERAARDAAEEVARARGERDAALREAKAAKQALHEERSARRRAQAAAAGGAETAAWAGDPVALAARLDLMEAMSRPPARSTGVPETFAPGTGWQLPPQIHPDRKEAIDWLLGSGSPATVLVDGYNVGYSMPGEQVPGPARSRVMPVLARLHTMSNGRFRVVVVFDSDLGPVESPPTPGPVKVVFSDAGEIADDRIVSAAASIDGPVVVVSNDRMVRERSEAVGAVAVWSRSLIDWASSR